MKSVMAIIFSVLFVFAVSSVSFAVEEKEAKPKIPAEVTKLPGAAKIRQITGSVIAFVLTALTLPVICLILAAPGSLVTSAGILGLASFSSTAKETEETAKTKSTENIIAITLFIKLTSFH